MGSEWFLFFTFLYYWSLLWLARIPACRFFVLSCFLKNNYILVHSHFTVLSISGCYCLLCFPCSTSPGRSCLLTCSVVTHSLHSYHLCRLLDCVPSLFPCMPIFDDRGLLGFKTFDDFGLRCDSTWIIISKGNTYGNPPLPFTMHSRATQVILSLLLTFLERCSILCSTTSWAENRMVNVVASSVSIIVLKAIQYPSPFREACRLVLHRPG